MTRRMVGILILLLVWTAAVYGEDDTTAERWPDRVNVKGQLLEGQIEGLDARGIVFGTSFGRGTIRIDYADITHITSGRPLRIYFGSDEVEQGFLTGIENGSLILERPGGKPVPIRQDSIVTGLSVAEYEASGLKRLRTDFRHWNASLNLGWRYEETTIDKNKIEFGIGLRRRKKPTRMVFKFDYAYELQSVEGTEMTTKDELSTFFLGEFDWKEKWFLFARPAVDRDKPRLIEKRYYPAAGVGFRFYEDQNHLLQIPFGVGYVDETFIGYGDNSYTSVYIGFEGIYTFDSGITMTGNMLYMLGLSDPDKEFLMRLYFELKLPIVDPVALLMRVTNINDNNPAPDVGNNKLTTLTAISLDF
ncbi:MAG: DUF481 domain-containing protein [Desulfosarcina sp.]|nr:DUF481 domain-containing protein [Desulfosarcina sp.]MBC2745016.1 DUF481 domain-containing protein [Desulfosarcina sp.]MBC2767924.1 DUF481 domain-containing protein [Desulfosarcina sp.]